MAVYLGDVNTRARGLRTRLLQPHDFDRLVHARSLFKLQRELSAMGVVAADLPATPATLELAMRRRAAELMGILSRWSTEERKPVLAVLLEDEDRRSIGRILRGAEQGASSDARMSGLVPTAQLSERALRVLASQPTMTDVVRMLVLWRHPFGPPLVEAVSGPRPDLFQAEVGLQRAFARRALERARKAGADLLDYARQVVDVMNAWSALLHFPERDSAIVEMTYIEGGRWIGREAFEELLGRESLEDVRKALAHDFHDSPLRQVFESETRGVAELESAVLDAQIFEQRKLARVRPQGPGPLIQFSLELRAEALNVRRIIWGVALETPPAILRTQMVAL